MDKRILLSTLWIILVVNYIFCDVFSLMHAPDLRNILEGSVDGVELNQGFLLSFAIIMEIPMVMILVSRLAKYKLNRILHIIFGILLAIVQIGSLSVGEVTLHYAFFSMVEIGICIALVIIALKWKSTDIPKSLNLS